MRFAFLLILIAALGACAHQAQVPMVEGSNLANIGGHQPGHYAALVQTGGWDMTTKISGMSCMLDTYKADLNPSWDQAMKGALTAALENVHFVSAVLAAPELAKQGYDAQIAITQSNATTTMGVIKHFFGGEADSETVLDGILVITYPDGTQQQEPLHGKGSSKADVFVCGDATPAIANGGAAAVKEIVERTTTTVKLLLAQKVHR